MNHPSAKIRTKETQTLLQQVDDVLAQWRKFDFSRCLDAVELDQVVRDTDRARLKFGSKLFFVVIFGPLKAGKSTLTNTLAGEYVSPTGWGFETTLRPSLIICGDESRIDQYFSNDAEINHLLSQRKLKGFAASQPQDETAEQKQEREKEHKRKESKAHEAFDEIADCLRKIRKEEDLQGRIRRETRPLNEENLEAALVRQLVIEPLFTVIQCRGGHLLTPGVAIVDMPGLDGSKSNWRVDPMHTWVIKQAEFFLFVQSSVAAFNRETDAFLHDVVKRENKPPIWAVQNLFDARHWQPERQRREDERIQRERGQERIIELLKEAPRAVSGLNLGLAWDARLEGNVELQAKPEFAEFVRFETEFAKTLHAERELIHEKKCLNDLNDRLAEAKKQLALGVSRIAELRSKHQEVRDGMCAAQRSLDAVNYRLKRENAVRGEFATMAETAAKYWLDSLEAEVAKLRGRLDQKTTGTKVNAEIKSIAVKLGAEGDAKHFAKPPLLPQYIDLAHTNCETGEKDAIKECEKALKVLNLSELPQPLSPSTEDLPSMPHDDLTNDDLQEKKTILGVDSWIDKVHERSAILEHVEQVAKDWRQQIQTRKGDWVNQVLIDHFSTYCEKRRKHFRAHLQQLMADFDATAKPKEEAATATEHLIAQMNEALRNLELPLANAIASMK